MVGNKRTRERGRREQEARVQRRTLKDSKQAAKRHAQIRIESVVSRAPRSSFLGSYFLPLTDPPRSLLLFGHRRSFSWLRHHEEQGKH